MIKSEGLRLKFKKAVTTQFPAESPKVTTPAATACTSTPTASAHCVPAPLSLKPSNEGWIKEQSKIYGKGTNNELTSWQNAVNNAAYELSKEDQSLLYDRASLKLRAEAKARESYVFRKRSGSRSKLEKGDTQQEVKRTKLNSTQRANTMASLTSQLESVKNQVGMTQRYISNSSGLSNFEACSKAHTELRKLLVQKQSLENNLADLASKDAKYQKKLKKKKSSTITSSPCPQTPDIRTLFSTKRSTKVSVPEHGVSDSTREGKDTVNDTTVPSSLVKSQTTVEEIDLTDAVEDSTVDRESNRNSSLSVNKSTIKEGLANEDCDGIDEQSENSSTPACKMSAKEVEESGGTSKEGEVQAGEASEIDEVSSYIAHLRARLYRASKKCASNPNKTQPKKSTQTQTKQT